MNKILLIFWREYITRVRKRSFLIVTLLVPLGVLFLMSIQIALVAYSSGSKTRIAVKDDSGVIGHTIKDSKGLYFIQKNNMSLDELKNTYREPSLDFDGILYIPNFDLNNPAGIRYISDQVLGIMAKMHIEREIASEVRKQKLQKLGVDNKTYNQIAKVNISIMEETDDGNSSANTVLATGIGYCMGLLMYFVIFIYGNMVMRGVMEEKTNRIVEVILSSVKPFKLMLGKILGIGAVGLTQFAIWIVLLFGVYFVAGLIMAGTVDLSSTGLASSGADMDEVMAQWEMMQAQIATLPILQLTLSIIIFFLGGYILYAALFASLASAIDSESDAQSMTLPVSLPIILSIFILIAMLESPNSNLALWSSLFPLFSPVIMPARVAFGVSWWEWSLSILFLVIGCFFTIWLAARIYRVGILMYGKKPSFREIGKWLFR